MGEHTPHSKPDEQYPLLKIDGGGDVSHEQPAQALLTPGWGVNCTKNSRFIRWPELISACWMTVILCGISFLVFHTLGMGLYRRQQLIIKKCNNSKPASNVFYHHIVPRGSQIPFVLYTEYLANMASQYPLLYFNVIFLIDDYYPELHRGSKRHFPVFSSWLYNYKIDDIGKDAFIEFQKKYQNVNVTIISLSKYMSITPLKFKWRLIPQAHLIFYARVFSVWQNGGVGIDLRTFNNDYHNQFMSNPRIDTILRQHNDGIHTADYAKALNKIDNDEANAILSIFSGLFNHFINETRSFFNRTLPFPFISDEKPPLIRTHRSKRQTNNSFEHTAATEVSKDLINFYNNDNNAINTINVNLTTFKNESDEMLNTTTDVVEVMENTTDLQISKVDEKRNRTNTHKVVLFYDVFLSDNIHGPALPNLLIHKPPVSTKAHLLSIDSEGTFVAASSKLHPFLTHLISAGCFGMPPKFAIQDAFLTQCSGVFKEDVYCNNIYIL